MSDWLGERWGVSKRNQGQGRVGSANGGSFLMSCSGLVAGEHHPLVRDSERNVALARIGGRRNERVQLELECPKSFPTLSSVRSAPPLARIGGACAVPASRTSHHEKRNDIPTSYPLRTYDPLPAGPPTTAPACESIAYSSRDGVSNPRRCHGQVSS